MFQRSLSFGNHRVDFGGIINKLKTCAGPGRIPGAGAASSVCVWLAELYRSLAIGVLVQNQLWKRPEAAGLPAIIPDDYQALVGCGVLEPRAAVSIPEKPADNQIEPDNNERNSPKLHEEWPVGPDDG